MVSMEQKEFQRTTLSANQIARNAKIAKTHFAFAHTLHFVLSLKILSLKFFSLFPTRSKYFAEKPSADLSPYRHLCKMVHMKYD
jgi:hypothetical protein